MNEPLPMWVTITVTLGVFGLLAYNVIFVGPEGYPISIMLGGLLGVYGGVKKLVDRRANGNDE